MGEMNVPYLFVMKMEDGTPVKISAIGVTTMERTGVDFAIVRLQILR